MERQIDLVHAASLRNLPHYWMSSREVTILQNQVQTLLQEGLVSPNRSSCAVPALLVPKKGVN